MRHIIIRTIAGIVFAATAVISAVKGDLTNAVISAAGALAFLGSAAMLYKKSRKGNA
ncbi:MAG: hypothetical protein K6E50_15760 [Lachnospiraceae bacterium]|nr:hypothetical protein [Lachnospiraceae bacterium]